LSGEELVQRCIAEGVGVIHTPDYDPFAGRTDEEKREWHLFVLFLSFDRAAGRGGGEPNRVADHIEWVLQRPFQNVSEWLGPEGERFRKRPDNAGAWMSEDFKAAWAAFLTEHHDWTLAEAINKLQSLQQEFERRPRRVG
jgi:hypothetical protein